MASVFSPSTLYDCDDVTVSLFQVWCNTISIFSNRWDQYVLILTLYVTYGCTYVSAMGFKHILFYVLKLRHILNEYALVFYFGKI